MKKGGGRIICFSLVHLHHDDSKREDIASLGFMPHVGHLGGHVEGSTMAVEPTDVGLGGINRGAQTKAAKRVEELSINE